MGLVREPEGVDFVVNSRPLKEWEKEQISEVIRHYKKTGEIKKIPVSAKKDNHRKEKSKQETI